MRLTDLLQLTNDLNQQTAFFLTLDKQPVPLAKLKITNQACLLYPGKKPLTKAKITSLVKHLHGRNIPLWIQNKTEKVPVYGIQIIDGQNSVRLT
ncbi:hypothetical protein OZX56_06310 [Lactobacillus sp. ESL0684]|uniref:hypothetical protein n=1 Tax=unclassified Lactobacillus TaxID=2620435 RepID=UPI0023F61EA7|nr:MULTISPECIES: hypothetical protein [unclassified Lactobacillus]WEV40394.1 hypothetical protein OZX59_00315 [Lactobacillus sp. ESL0681]WEV43157.1 hypothetical protein OZX56_06310 [Lactobacillus sp. ESL0684]